MSRDLPNRVDSFVRFATGVVLACSQIQNGCRGSFQGRTRNFRGEPALIKPFLTFGLIVLGRVGGVHLSTN